MADDVLRMRATIVNEQALASVREMVRALGAIPKTAVPAAKTMNAEFNTLANTIKRMGGELRNAIPALGGMGLGAAGVGLAFSQLMRTLTDMSKRVIELKYASKELGMSERDVRAWGYAAEKVGVSSQSMTQGLVAFKKTTDGLKYNIGGVRSELLAMGAGPVVARMMAATTQAEKLKIAFQFKEVLMKDDPSGFKARTLFDMLGLGGDKARLSLEALEKQFKKTKEITPQEEARIQKYHDQLVDLGAAWDHLQVKAGVALFPALTRELQTITTLVEKMEKLDEIIDSWTGKGSDESDLMGRLVGKLRGMLGIGQLGGSPPGSAPATPQTVPEAPSLPAPHELTRPQNFRGSPGAPGYKPISMSMGGDESSEASRVVQRGVYDALVEFEGHVRASGGGGSASGFQPASLTSGGVGGSNPFGGSRTSVSGSPGGSPSGPGGSPSSPGGSPSPPAPNDSRSGGAGSTRASPGGSNVPGVTRNGPAGLNDERGRPIDAGTMGQIEALGRKGDIAGVQQVLNSKGYRASGPWCGIFASRYVKSAGFKPPAGSAIASNWNDWGQKTSASDINAPGRPLGSMVASYNVRTYNGGVGAPLGKGQTGGHVMTIVPGSYDEQTRTAMFIDQRGVKRRQAVSNKLDLRYAGDTAVAAEKARRDGTGATARLDGANSQRQPQSSVNVTVNSNGTKADASVKRQGPAFQEPAITQKRQMQATEEVPH